jgi:hypothetical protein
MSFFNMYVYACVYEIHEGIMNVLACSNAAVHLLNEI